MTGKKKKSELEKTEEIFYSLSHVKKAIAENAKYMAHEIDKEILRKYYENTKY